MAKSPEFNVRVYGLIKETIEGRECILLSKEYKDGPDIIKFPGGGIELGEGPEQALIREFDEEAHTAIDVVSFFHTSGNYHKSYFSPRALIALYWVVKAPQGIPHEFEDQPVSPGSSRRQQLFWKPLDEIKIEDLSHTTDKEVTQKILAQGL